MAVGEQSRRDWEGGGSGMVGSRVRVCGGGEGVLLVGLVLFGEGGEGASSFTPSFMVGHSQWRQLFEGTNLEVTRASALWLKEHMCTYPPTPHLPTPPRTHTRTRTNPAHPPQPNTHMPSDCNQQC